MTDYRDDLAAQMTLYVAQAMASQPSGPEYSPLETQMRRDRDTETAQRFAKNLLATNTVVPLHGTALHEALEEATGWSEHGYSPDSKAYWTGMRDTLRVVLGITTEKPRDTTADPAAFSILSAQYRAQRDSR